MKHQNAATDVSQLPTFAHGAKNPLWWGALSFMVIEALAFVFAVATYLYFESHNDTWPLGPQPVLFWGTVMVVLMVLSEIPNVWLKKAAKVHDLKKVRIGMIIMSALGIIAMGIRYFEFKAINIHWTDNAYGSIFWFLIGYHTTHVLTDLGETIVMTVLVHIGPVDMRRFPEVEDNQDYWHFVVITWLVVYTVLYWVPRWFEVAP